MFGYRDDKLGHLKSVSIRNLYIDCGEKSQSQSTHLKVSQNATAAINSDLLVRRGSILPSIPTIDTEDGEFQLIDINRRSLLDSFYTLHVPIDGEEEKLVYISEVQTSDMNPNFAGVSLPYIPTTSQSHKIIINLWCKTSFESIEVKQKSSSWLHLSKYNINLKRLIYLGIKTDDVEELLQRNSLILNLNGRFYTLPHSMKRKFSRPPVIRHTRKSTSHGKLIANSYSFDAIRSILKLSNSLNELRITKHNLSKQVKDLTEELTIKSNLETPGKTLSRLKFQKSILEKSLLKQKGLNDNLISEILTTKIRMNKIREIIDNRLELIVEMANNSIDLIEAQLDPIEETLSQYVFPSIIKEIQIFGKVLSEAFLIQNINNSVRFSIMGLEFPSSIKELLNICYYDEKKLINFNSGTTLDNTNNRASIEQINAGISYIVEIINIIAIITNCNLRYKMLVFGSRSIVLDPISDNMRNSKVKHDSLDQSQVLLHDLYYDHSKTERISKPEDSGNVSQLRNYEFEQGLSLLNKNLVFLIGKVTTNFNNFSQITKKGKISNNIPIDCLDNFLWNLQYLLLFITAPIEHDDAN
ncbi:hypothetical protein DFJ63DRAFT_315933 [Scheffersomyces coipomensis]|uniref:uncharacterized protein n=1 Tax=Scheffersomyces coipomensis TaxID=1788519 RepID=UPI00315C5998